MPFTPMAGKKEQHTLSAGQASESTAHNENIISTSEKIMEVLYINTMSMYLSKCHHVFVSIFDTY